MATPTIAFIGAGKMATALARGFVSAGMVETSSIRASDPGEAALDAFCESAPGCVRAETNADAVDGADVVILAVKPQHLPGVLAGLATAPAARPLFVSIAAGFSLASLESGLPTGARVVRVMPNTPSLVGRGVSAFSPGQHATGDDSTLVGRLLEAVGAAHEVPESQLDAVTGLSGSGPAFVYTIIEAMTDAGIRAGLPAAVAADLAARTVAGAAHMVLETGDHPALLRRAVTSPGGTTAAGLAALDRHGLRHALGEAVAAAVVQSKELGKG
ncbi:MAG: pyrroline-5-carboxylate reductase [Planctomycetota bacterium]